MSTGSSQRPPLRSVRIVSDSPRVVYPLRDDERRRLEQHVRSERRARHTLLVVACVLLYLCLVWLVSEWRAM